MEDLAGLEGQASTNLVNWMTVPSAALVTNDLLVLSDSGSTRTFPHDFYRMVEHYA